MLQPWLKGGELVNFLEAQNSFQLEISHLGDNYFRVLSSKEFTEFNQEQIATQLSLDFITEEPALSENQKIQMQSDQALSPPTPTQRTSVIKKRGIIESKDVLADPFKT